MDSFLDGLRVASMICSTGFLFTIGVWAGIKAGSVLFGPININVGRIQITVDDQPRP